MSTRFTKSETDGSSIPTGYEGYNTPDDFEIPSCTIEDVDRALFDLFNNSIPFYFELEKQTRKTPVIFATGERFAILRRQRPLRDKSGALILPLISIVRDSISQDVSRGSGPGQVQPIVVKKRLDKKDPVYQRLINKVALRNQDDVASSNHKLTNSGEGSAAGTVATRREPEKPSRDARAGKLLSPTLGKNIFEIITIPPVKFYQATYQITFWAQYTQQMNDMITALMSSYQDMHKRTFRLETKVGYWFVGYVTGDLASDSNMDDFVDSERLIRYSFNVEVPAFIVNPSFPGAPNALRSFMSSPEISFDIIRTRNPLVNQVDAGPISGDVNKFILQDIQGAFDEFPGTLLTGPDGVANADPRDASKSFDTATGKTVNIGGAKAGPLRALAAKIATDPFTGKTLKVPMEARLVTSKGESTYKDLSTGKRDNDLIDLADLDL